jgi:hypothetical protein
VEGIQLPTALALLLGTDLIGVREWPGDSHTILPITPQRAVPTSSWPKYSSRGTAL